MLKRFVSSLFVICLLMGCGSSSTTTTTTNTPEATTQAETKAETKDTAKALEQVKKQAETIVNDLGLENVSAAKDRIIPGLFFFEEGAVEASAFYLADKQADCVGVFKANDVDSCKESIKTYLETLKAQLQTYAPDEIFKVDNSVVESNGDLVVMIVCDDIESAKKEASKILGN